MSKCRAEFTKRFVLLTVLFPISSPLVFASDFTIADMLTNILIVVKGFVALVWNLRVVLGLGVVLFGFIWYYRLSKSDSVSLSLPIVTVIAGAVLTFNGALELIPEFFDIKSENQVQVNSDQRANIAANAKYTLKQGKSTQ